MQRGDAKAGVQTERKPGNRAQEAAEGRFQPLHHKHMCGSVGHLLLLLLHQELFVG